MSTTGTDNQFVGKELEHSHIGRQFPHHEGSLHTPARHCRGELIN